jgi:hypothetical protein
MTTVGGQIVMYGGDTSPPAILGDTWTFDGAAWAQQGQKGQAAPGERYVYTLAVRK